MRRFILLAVSCALAGSAVAQAQTDRPLLLRNVHVFDPHTAAMSAAVDILIRSDRIAEVGPGLSAENAETIDCEGGYALSGLFDSHTHLCHLTTMGGDSLVVALNAFIEKGVLQVRDVGGPLAVMKSLHDRISSGELRGPEIFYAGPMLEKSPLTWAKINEAEPNFTVAVNDSATVDSLIAEYLQNGASLIKTFSKWDRDIYDYLLAKATAAGLPVAHDPGPPLFHQIPMDVAFACGARSVEHGKAPWPAVLTDSLALEHDSLMAAEAPQMARMMFLMQVFEERTKAISLPKLDRLIADAVARDVYVCPTLQVFPMMRREGGPADEPPMQKAMREKSLAALDSMSVWFTQKMAQGGIRMLVGMDWCFVEGTFAEIRLLQEAGLPAAEILRGLTLYPARFLNKEDRYGSIEPDKVANILVVKEDPLADATRLEATFLVVQSGRPIWQADKPR